MCSGGSGGGYEVYRWMEGQKASENRLLELSVSHIDFIILGEFLDSLGLLLIKKNILMYN